MCVAGLNLVLATWRFHTKMRSVCLANQELFNQTKIVIVTQKKTEMFLTIFFIDSSENDFSYFDFFHKSKYFDISSLNGVVEDQNFSLMHFNVRSIQKNVDELANLLKQHKALSDVLAIMETKPKPDQVHTY